VVPPGQLTELPFAVRANKADANKRIHSIEILVSTVDDITLSDSEQVKYFGYKK